MKGKNIDFGWESREERIRRGMLISPRNKLIWLKEINELRCLCVPARIRKRWRVTALAAIKRPDLKQF